MNTFKLILAVIAALFIVIMLKSIIFGVYLFLWVIRLIFVAIPIALIIFLLMSADKKD